MTRIALIGFMGSGKTTAARAAAEALKAQAIDVDAELERSFGRPIERVFDEDGEALFRAREEELTLEALARTDAAVVSLGGGAIGSAHVREALTRGDRRVVWMDIAPDVAWERAHGAGRPLARDRQSFERLHGEREPVYATLADVGVPADRGTDMAAVLAALEGLPKGAKLLWATSASADYPVYIGSGLVTRSGFWPLTVQGRRYVITDERVLPHYGECIAQIAHRFEVPAGEGSKTIAHADAVWRGLAGADATRGDVVVAVGGGVVGDLAGFCAATYQRGVRYVQVPTTLVAQVDSAYGGKTGIDLPEAKNYVGAYHQPSAVIADPETLATLPAAELAAGYAEVLKTALLAGGELWESVRAGADPSSLQIVAACVRIKLRIVARDERDVGLRQVLNLGHTVAHALETATGYRRYRHGEAVGLGLLAALRLSGQPALRDEVAVLLEARGLPTRLDGADPDAVVSATAADKKRLSPGPVPFVLLDRPGKPRAGCPVEPAELRAAVGELATR
ncbi:MAG: bifunctional shikimate kinase/3-dehydroquinate synthase [Solirubrobacteraceae bacterium]